MRIIAGELKGRHFETPKGKQTHPMADRVKNALFNTLGDISGLRVLDPFGGSGGVSIEAVSRGAEFAQITERSSKSFRIIKKNIEDLGLEGRVKVTHASCNSWSENNEDQKFDLILANPPFWDLQFSTLEQLIKHLTPNGLMVLCHPGREDSPTVNGVVVVDNHNYGDAALSLYRLDNSRTVD